MKKLTIGALIAVCALGGTLTTVVAQGNAEATVDVRVWQSLEDTERLYISARPESGSWATLGTIRLPLVDGRSQDRRYLYGDIRLDVPLAERPPVTVEVRVWQHWRDFDRVYISARPESGSWATLGTIRLPLVDGETARYRYGDIRLDVTLPTRGVVSLAGEAGVYGSVDGHGDDARFGAGALGWPPAWGLAVDHDGSVVVADGSAIRRILPDGTVTTIAGGRSPGYLDGPGESARFRDARDIAIHPDGSIYVADVAAYRIRKITPDGMVTTVAGSDPSAGESRINLEGHSDAPADRAIFVEPRRLALAPDGGLYIVDHLDVRHLSPTGWVTTVGRGEMTGSDLVGRLPRDIAVDAEGNVYVLEGREYYPGSREEPAYRVQKLSPDGEISEVFRSHSGVTGLLVSPGALAVGGGGEVYLANTARHQIVRIANRDTLVAVAGTGEDSFLDGDRAEAHFSWPGQIASAPGGALVVMDQFDSVVRVVYPDADGGFAPVPLAPVPELPRLEGVQVRVLAGQFDPGFVDAVGEAAGFNEPFGLALDADGAVIVADSGNSAIRRVSRDGTVITLAGGNGWGGLDGPGDVAQFELPRDVAVAADGFIYVADLGVGLRRVAPDGTVGPAVAGEPAISPRALAVAPDGSLIVAEVMRILRVAPDGAVASLASRRPHRNFFGLAVDGDGNTFWVDTGGKAGRATALRRMDRDGAVTTVFEQHPGQYGGFFSHTVADLAVAPDGTFYLADRDYGRILSLSPDGEAAIGAWGEGDDQEPTGILITPDGSLIVSDGLSVLYEITFGDGAASE